MKLTIQQISQLKESFDKFALTKQNVIGSLAVKISELKNEIDSIIDKAIVEPAKPILDKLMQEFTEYKKQSKTAEEIKEKEQQSSDAYVLALNDIFLKCQNDVLELKSSPITKLELCTMTISADAINAIKLIIE